MRNAEIALHFDELADLYELDGAIVHRVLAYRNAAKAIRESTASVEQMTRVAPLPSCPGIGKTIEEKLNALFDTGVIPSAEKLKAKYPPGLVEVTRLPGFGAKKARKLFDALGSAVARRPPGGRRRTNASRTCPASGRRRRRTSGSHSKPASSQRHACCCRRLSRSPTRSSARSASTLRPTASRSPAPPDAGPRAARTSTSSPRAPMRTPCRRRSPNCRSSARSSTRAPPASRP